MSRSDAFLPMTAWLEQAWLQRYLDRALDAEEQAWFETYLLAHPHLVEAVEADTGLRDAFALAGSAGGTGEGGDAGGGDGRPGSPTRPSVVRPRPPSRRGLPPWLGLAAGLLLGLGLAALWPTASGPGPGLANPTRIVFDTLRGGHSPPHIEPGDPDSPWLLVEVPVPPGSRIDSVRLEGGPQSAVFGSVAATPDGFGLLLLDARATGNLVIDYAYPDGVRNQTRFQLPMRH
ncbi:MAG: hypothetical protein U0S76_13115 [Pseudoxanthomonas sp.]|nr:hypothetical protein [Pseudoxanthomonas sp.]